MKFMLLIIAVISAAFTGCAPYPMMGQCYRPPMMQRACGQRFVMMRGGAPACMSGRCSYQGGYGYQDSNYGYQPGPSYYGGGYYGQSVYTGNYYQPGYEQQPAPGTILWRQRNSVLGYDQPWLHSHPYQ